MQSIGSVVNELYPGDLVVPRMHGFWDVVPEASLIQTTTTAGPASLSALRQWDVRLHTPCCRGLGISALETGLLSMQQLMSLPKSYYLGIAVRQPGRVDCLSGDSIKDETEALLNLA